MNEERHALSLAHEANINLWISQMDFFLCMLVQGMHDLFEDTPSPHIVYVWTNSDPGHAVTVQVPETFHRCSVYTRGHLSSRAP